MAGRRAPPPPPPPSPWDGRKRLLVPVALVLTLLMTAAMGRALITGDVQPLIILSAPFGLLCGYLFVGDGVIRRARNGE